VERKGVSCSGLENLSCKPPSAALAAPSTASDAMETYKGHVAKLLKGGAVLHDLVGLLFWRLAHKFTDSQHIAALESMTPNSLGAWGLLESKVRRAGV